jgi:hypothetical protein
MWARVRRQQLIVNGKSKEPREKREGPKGMSAQIRGKTRI